jgi:hypothetical protein
MAAPSPASAGPITVANASFETLPAGGLPSGCGTGCSFSVNDPIPGWTSTGSFGQFQPGVQAGNFTYFNTVTDGITVAYSNGGTISQTVGDTVVAGTTYTLSVDVGERKDVPDPGSVFLIVGTQTVLATGIPALPGDWSTFTASYTATALDAGAAIEVLLSSPGVQGDWDNVHLAATAVPEPASLVLLGAGLLAFGVIRRRRKSA